MDEARGHDPVCIKVMDIGEGHIRADDGYLARVDIRSCILGANLVAPVQALGHNGLGQGAGAC